jgi:hypothetical protein
MYPCTTNPLRLFLISAFCLTGCATGPRTNWVHDPARKITIPAEHRMAIGHVRLAYAPRQGLLASAPKIDWAAVTICFRTDNDPQAHPNSPVYCGTVDDWAVDYIPSASAVNGFAFMALPVGKIYISAITGHPHFSFLPKNLSFDVNANSNVTNFGDILVKMQRNNEAVLEVKPAPEATALYKRYHPQARVTESLPNPASVNEYTVVY